MAPLRTDPIIITGAGHSGTRGLVTILKRIDGLYLGDTNNVFKEWDFYRRLAASVNASLLSLPDVHDHNVIPPDVTTIFRASREQREAAVDRIRREIAAQPELSLPPPSAGAWAIKTPRTTLCLEIWLEAFPQATIVNLVRDGRDVAVATHSVAAGSVARRFALWRARVNRVWAYQREGMPIIDFRYEDLPEPGRLQGLCDALGLRYSPAMHDDLEMHVGHGAELMKTLPYERFELLRYGYDPHFEHLVAISKPSELPAI